MVMERGADRGVRNAGGDAAVHRTGAVQQFGAHAALDGDAIAMYAHQLKPKQVIEGVAREEGPECFGSCVSDRSKSGDFSILEAN